MTVRGIYYIQNYKISDNNNDKIIARDEVQIKSKDGSYREITFEEWAKLAELKSIQEQHNLLLINKNQLSGKIIVNILEKTPALLNKVIEEMGGVGYVMLALEEHLLSIARARVEKASANLKIWEEEFAAFYARVKNLTLENKLEILKLYLFHSEAIDTFYGFLPKETREKIPLDKENANNIRQIAAEVLAYFKKSPEIVTALIKPLAISIFIFNIKKTKYAFEKTLADALLYKQTDCDRDASLFVHFAKKQNWDVGIFSLNNHTVPVFNSPLFPNGRIFVESTNGLIVDLDMYKKKLRIACLQLGFPDDIFIKNPEKIVVSVLTQKINDLLETIEKKKTNQEKVLAKEKAELKRYMLLANKIVPNDPSKLVLSQMVFATLGDEKKAAEYRLELVKLSKQSSPY